MSFKLIENVLPNQIAEDISSLLLGSDFPWFYQDDGVVSEGTNYKYLTHIFYCENTVNSELYRVVKPLIKHINPRSLYRIKANLYLPTPTIIEHGLHVDFDWDDIFTAVYYVNSNNGYTKLSDNTKIESVQNTLAVLDPLVPHTSSTSTDNARVTINFNWF